MIINTQFYTKYRPRVFYVYPYEGYRSVTPLDAARVNRTIFHNHSVHWYYITRIEGRDYININEILTNCIVCMKWMIDQYGHFLFVYGKICRCTRDTRARIAVPGTTCYCVYVLIPGNRYVRRYVHAAVPAMVGQYDVHRPRPGGHGPSRPTPHCPLQDLVNETLHRLMTRCDYDWSTKWWQLWQHLTASDSTVSTSSVTTFVRFARTSYSS